MASWWPNRHVYALDIGKEYMSHLMTPPLCQQSGVDLGAGHLGNRSRRLSPVACRAHRRRPKCLQTAKRNLESRSISFDRSCIIVRPGPGRDPSFNLLAHGCRWRSRRSRADFGRFGGFRPFWPLWAGFSSCWADFGCFDMFDQFWPFWAHFGRLGWFWPFGLNFADLGCFNAILAIAGSIFAILGHTI